MIVTGFFARDGVPIRTGVVTAAMWVDTCDE